MELKEYLHRNNIKNVAFAKKIGTSKCYLSDVLAGRRRFSERLATYVEVITNGEVTKEELRKDKPQATEIASLS